MSYKANKETISTEDRIAKEKAYQKAYYEAHKEEIAAQQKAYREAHKKAYREARKEKAARLKDHLGFTYDSVTAMCNQYGIPRTTYIRRLERGWTKEKALTTPSGNNKANKETISTEDRIAKEKARNKAYREAHKEEAAAYREAHKEEKKAYNEAHKKEIATYQKAYRESHKEERAAYQKAYLEAHKEEHAACKKAYYEAHKEKIAVERKAKRKAYREAHKGEVSAYLKIPDKNVDHLGFTYDSITAMCKKYNIPRATYSRRLERGWTKEQALTTPSGNTVPHREKRKSSDS